MYAEDPRKDYQPSAGPAHRGRLPRGPVASGSTRWAETGQQVTSHYDPMLAKVIVHAPGRTEAFAASRRALAATRFTGVQTNLPLLREAVGLPDVLAATHTTGTLAGVTDDEPYIDVVRPGVMTTVQDWPGRLGFWDVGISPSGPMDDLSFRLGNRALGNAEGAPGPGVHADRTAPAVQPRDGRLRDGCARARDGRRVAGAAVGARDGPRRRRARRRRTARCGPAHLRPAARRAGRAAVPRLGVDLLDGRLRRVHRPRARRRRHPGARASRSARRPSRCPRTSGRSWCTSGRSRSRRDRSRRRRTSRPRTWRCSTPPTWQVQTHANRTGIRLTGPKPQWARPDGGEAGLHPSNLHDNPYSVGALNVSGDTPILLGPDGPSLGGFACPLTVVVGHRWKMGQIRPGDTVRLVPGARRDRGRPAHRRRPARVRAPRPGRRSPVPTVTTACSPGSPARPTSSTCAAATTTCSSSTARWCWTSACACACTPWARR